MDLDCWLLCELGMHVWRTASLSCCHAGVWFEPPPRMHMSQAHSAEGSLALRPPEWSGDGV
jgi:hypothetical protein